MPRQRRFDAADPARAYELYQERVQGQSQADQDWLEAEQETRNGESPK